jgi:hypothetical protein
VRVSGNGRRLFWLTPAKRSRKDERGGNKHDELSFEEVAGGV